MEASILLFRPVSRTLQLRNKKEIGHYVLAEVLIECKSCNGSTNSAPAGLGLHYNGNDQFNYFLH